MSINHACQQTPVATSDIDTYIAIDWSTLLVKPISRQRYHPTAVHQESGRSLKSLCSHSAPAIALAAGSCYTVP
jgi:hypothetical protein